MNDTTEIKVGFLDSLWKFLSSIKLTVVVLLSLALLSIIGTLIPQNQSSADYLRAFGPFRFQLLATLDIFDMYHSWWFRLLIAILVINIVICSIDRLRISWRIIFVTNPKFNLAAFRQRKSRREFAVPAKAQSLQEGFQKRIAKSFGYWRVVRTEKGFAITAEKGRWTRLGVYVVHLSVVLMLIGGMVGSKFGFDGFVNIPEGQTVNTIQVGNLGATLQLPFAIRCDDFDMQVYDTGAPKEFRSSLTILENGKPALQKDIIVNDPLRYKGISIYQSSYGQLSDSPDPATASTSPPEQFELSFRSLASGMIYTRKAAPGQKVEIPEGIGTFVVDRFEPKAQFKSMDLGPVVVGTVTPAQGEPQEVLVPLKYPKFDIMRKGKVVISVANAAPTPEPRFYTGLQVTRDPGVGLVYTGFILMILGCIVTFFMSHQQVVVDVQPKGLKTSVVVSGKTNRNKVGFQNKLQRITDRLSAFAAEKNVNGDR